MKEDFFRRITDSEKEDMLAYHELSHYLCSEISRIIEPNFDKPKKIVLSTCKSTPWQQARIVGVCSPKTITKEILKIYGKESTQVKELEKDFFFKNMMRISHKTLMRASGYLSSSIYVFKDDVEHFINAIYK